MAESQSTWRGRVALQFERRGSAGDERTIHQGQASSPLKLQRAQWQSSGHCELPILHTAGGLVGGDELEISAQLAPQTRPYSPASQPRRSTAALDAPANNRRDAGLGRP